MPFTIVLDRFLGESVSEYAAILDLANRDQDHSLEKSYDELLKNDNKQELLAKIVDSSKLLLVKLSDKSFEPTVNLYLHTLNLLGSELDVDMSEVISQVLNNLDLGNYDSSKTQVKPSAVISVLCNIFNLVPENAPLRATILSDIVKIASANELDSMLLPIAQNFSVWLAPIEGLTTEQWRALANEIFSKVYEQEPVKALEFYKSLIESDTDSKLLAPEDYDFFFTKLLSCREHINLAGLDIGGKFSSSAYSELFVLVQHGNFKGCGQFVDSHKDLAAKVDGANIVFKVKCLALTRVLEEIELRTGSNEFSYKQISESLDIPVAGVEEFLIKCIHRKLINGRLSQVKQVFYLSRINRLNALREPMSADDWKRANAYLKNWAVTVADMESLIKNIASKKGKKMMPPQAIQIFHQQKQELKERQRQEEGAVEAQAEASEQ